jgi:hypothetical protein
MSLAITEKQVVALWWDILQKQSDLKTTAAEAVRIIYPGRRNDDRGADFKDAIIATNRGQLKGDIEVHVKASHWWAHRHHQDPAYNKVVLHVVYQSDSPKTIVMESGFAVPTLALGDCVNNTSKSATQQPLPCRGIGYRGNTRLVTGVLDEAGEARFLAQATIFEKTIKQSGAGQTLYRGIMTALGYSKNKAVMAELAGRVPLKELEAAASDEISDNDYLVRCQSRFMNEAELMPPGKWHFFKVRPGNHPAQRIAAMSHLLLRYRHQGLLAGLEDSFKEAVENNTKALEQALLVAPVLLGQARAADIVVNVLLPFVYSRGPAELSQSALKLYRDYHAVSENSLVKHMRQQLGLSRYPVNTARRQQGLIHLYKTQCLEGGCNMCPLNNIT